MMFKKPRRDAAEINGSSMADIAFLLLIFFLVTTTINVDTGIGLVLPPPLDPNETPPPIRERNLMNMLVDAEGRIMMDEELVSINDVKPTLVEFIENPNDDPNLSVSPEAAIVSVKTVREAPYRIYIDMLDEIMGAYRELRDNASRQNYGVPYGALEDGSAQQKQIQDLYPLNISIAEHED